MTPVACAECGTEVLCEKFSAAHTQVQWTDRAASVCPRIAARVAAGELSARVRSCPALRAGIEAAVREGRLEVPADA
ncbi:hypothetical protein ACWGHM_17445 [Streptomyces sp. NPDC054904]|uniref:hypothetical protein n=1 Tax=unclassified Streptomyces TaxID=2593676 RepID=UPI0024819FD4|nr:MULTISPECIES: hypothetical protein [unclassified Streptomyces]MDA5282130.1 hypothetical protein [Streptomyces sp. Isolate_45]MDX2396040.1 hypothetical protein [Streptomyces sp. DK15]